MFEIDDNVSKVGATRSQRVAVHSANLGAFVRAGASRYPSTRVKGIVFTRSVHDPRNKHGTQDRAPLSLDPLFRRFKGDSKASAIKDTNKRAGNFKDALARKVGNR